MTCGIVILPIPQDWVKRRLLQKSEGNLCKRLWGSILEGIPWWFFCQKLRKGVGGQMDKGGWREEILERPEIQASFLYLFSYALLGQGAHISGECVLALWEVYLSPTPSRQPLFETSDFVAGKTRRKKSSQKSTAELKSAFGEHGQCKDLASTFPYQRNTQNAGFSLTYCNLKARAYKSWGWCQSDPRPASPATQPPRRCRGCLWADETHAAEPSNPGKKANECTATQLPCAMLMAMLQVF